MHGKYNILILLTVDDCTTLLYSYPVIVTSRVAGDGGVRRTGGGYNVLVAFMVGSSPHTFRQIESLAFIESLFLNWNMRFMCVPLMAGSLSYSLGENSQHDH